MPRSRLFLSLINLTLAAVQTGFGPFVSVWLTERGWDQGDIGMALSLGTIAGFLGQLPAGLLIDATSRKRLICAVALGILGLSALMLALFPQWVPVLAAEMLHGLASCVLAPAIAALTMSLAGHEAFGEQTGINNRYASIGNAAAAVLLGVWATYLSQRGVLLLTAGMVPLALLALLGIPARDGGPVTETGTQAAPTLPGSCECAAKPNWHIVFERGFLAFALCSLLFQLANAALLPLALNTYVAPHKNLDWIVSACIIAPQIIVAGLSPWLGRLANSWGRRPILLLGLLALPLRALLIALLPNPEMLIPIELLDGISGAMFGLMLPLIAADVSRRLGCLNLSISVFNLTGALGATVSTTLAGLVADYAGVHVSFLMLASFGAAAVAVVWLMMPETRPARRIQPEPVMVTA